MNNPDLPVVYAKDMGNVPSVRTDRVLDAEEPSASSGMNVYDILFILFRHKWKIILCTLAGAFVAAAVYLAVPPVYQSQAKLLVRYVVDSSAVDSLDSQVKTPTPDNKTLINSEVEILTSSDLIRQVAESVGIAKLTRGGSATLDKAVEYIYHYLGVWIVKDTNIILISFDSNDPSLPKPVLEELVKRYFDKHLEVHRSTGAFEFVAQETATLKKELAKTEAELKKLRETAGIVTVAGAKASLAAELGKTQQDLDTAEADLVSQEAGVKDLEKSLALPGGKTPETPAQPVSGDIVQNYQALLAQLTQVQKAETDLLLKYTPQSLFVKTKASQISELQKQRDALIKQYPGLLETALAATQNESGQTLRPNLVSERAILAGMQSKVDALRTRMSDLQAKARTITEMAPRIEELERKAEVEETNYKHSEASLEKARIDETLDPSRMPNISIVQTPSPATKGSRNIGKVLFGVAGGGLGVGVAIALLIELILDRTVKRSLELEKRLNVPLLLSIPYFARSKQRLRLPDVANYPQEAIDGTEPCYAVDGVGESLQPFCAAIRDRLGVFFQVNNMSYRPKLVAVTGLSKNAGTSTLATGLAGALSEASNGKVLLVDKLTSAKGFYDMLADFRRSDLDYVIFDMPSLGDTSSTLPLAGFMDTVLLVVEAEKSSRGAVKRAYAQLAAKTNVSVVFNKSRSYGPRWLEAEV